MNKATELVIKEISTNKERYNLCTTKESLKSTVEKYKSEFLGYIETGRGKTWSWRIAREEWDSIEWDLI